MAGQPDWQRFASATGPKLFGTASTINGNSGVMYVGPWRSVFTDAFNTAGTGTYSLVYSWYEDAAGNINVHNDNVVIGNQLERIGWNTVYGPFLGIAWQHTVSAANDQLVLRAFGNMLDSVRGTLATPKQYLQASGTAVASGSTFTLNATYQMPGPATLTVDGTAGRMTYALQQMATDGTWSTFDLYRVSEAYATRTFDVVIPDAPVRLVVGNPCSSYTAVADTFLVPH